MKCYENIREYLNNTLSDKDRKDFENEMNRDASLQRAVLLYADCNKVYELIMEEDLHSEIMKAERDGSHIFIKWQNFLLPLRRMVVAAAAASVLLLVSTAWYANSHATNDALVSAYFDPPNLSGTRGEAGSDDLMTKAKIKYSKGQYKECVTLLSAIQEGNSDYEEALLLLGYSNMKLNEPELALQSFSSMDNSPLMRNDRTQWHIALAHLQSDHMSLVFDYLDQILGNPQHDYYTEAHQLKDCLDSVWRKLVI